MLPILWLILFWAALNLSLAQKEDPIAKTPLGLVRGTIEKSHADILYYAFRGIRFAKAPVGELRFRNPIPVEPWQGIYDATKDGMSCPQELQTDANLFSEDCLFINVYTRRYNQTDDLRPVFFYIHGGGFFSGSGGTEFQGPQRFMDNDIVVVTTNYRLQTLGFFSTGDKWAPGNYGMKDQVAALRWVQNNIASLGGDPKSVTIGGQSAGGASVILQMISPMSRGLFHGAIAMSGAPTSDWVVHKDPSGLGKLQARLLNCTTESTEQMVSCIRNVPAFETTPIYPGFWKWGNDPLVTLAPVVEVEGDEERFLTRDPTEALLDGDFAHVPLIIGTTTNEFEFRSLYVINNQTLADDMSKRWNEVAPLAFSYRKDDSASKELRQFFLKSLDAPITNDSWKGLGEMYADSIITWGVLRAATIMAKTSTAPVYLYQFNYQGRYSWSNWPGTSTPMGVSHADDTAYLWQISMYFPDFEPDSPEEQASERLHELWRNFIVTGNPTPTRTALNNITWPPLIADQPAYLDFAETTKVTNGIYYKSRFDLWERLFPLPKPKNNQR